MMLTGSDIEACIHNGSIVIVPFDPKHLNPNSYNLEMAPYLWTYRPVCRVGVLPFGRRNVIDPSVPMELEEHEIPSDGFEIHPGTLYLAQTVERAGSNVYAPHISGRSSTARLGIMTHLVAGFGDVGFIDHWTLEISCVEPVVLYPGMRIAQIYFNTVSGFPKTKYAGKYMRNDRSAPSSYLNQNRIRSKMFEEFQSSLLVIHPTTEKAGEIRHIVDQVGLSISDWSQIRFTPTDVSELFGLVSGSEESDRMTLGRSHICRVWGVDAIERLRTLISSGRIDKYFVHVSENDLSAQAELSIIARIKKDRK